VVDWIWSSGRNVIINVGAGVYDSIVSMEVNSSTVNPTDIISDLASYGTSTYRVVASTNSISETGSAVYSPVSVVEWKSCSTFPLADEWYRPPEDGWYLLKTDVDSNMRGQGGGDSLAGDWWWDTLVSTYYNNAVPNYRGTRLCRYNADPPVVDTYDDARWQEPGAVVDCAVALDAAHPLGPPSDTRWYWCHFQKGDPADFPVGQRFRTTTATEYANGAATGGVQPDAAGSPVSPDGNISLGTENGGTLDAEPIVPNPYPVVPWPTTTSPEPGETTGDVRDTDLFKVTFNIRLRKA
jgi:hypothetical protein